MLLSTTLMTCYLLNTVEKCNKIQTQPLGYDSLYMIFCLTSLWPRMATDQLSEHNYDDLLTGHLGQICSHSHTTPRSWRLLHNFTFDLSMTWNDLWFSSKVQIWWAITYWILSNLIRFGNNPKELKAFAWFHCWYLFDPIVFVPIFIITKNFDNIQKSRIVIFPWNSNGKMWKSGHKCKKLSWDIVFTT